MAVNVPISGKIGKAAPTAKIGGGIESGPPENKRTPRDSALSPDTITAKDDLNTAGSESVGDTQDAKPAMTPE